MQVFEIAEIAESETIRDEHEPLATQRQGRLSTVNPLRSPSPANMPRLRVNSLRPSDNFQTASPLAQLYQPLIVDGDIVEESEGDHGTLAPSVVSYGPTSRRRLASMVPVQRRNAADQAANSRPFPHSEGDKFSQGMLLSQSPDTESLRNGHAESKKNETDMSKQLEDIENRQRRMESLLSAIAQKLDGGIAT